METPEAKTIRVRVNSQEQLMLNRFRQLCEHGWGRLEIVVARGKVDAVYYTETVKTLAPTAAGQGGPRLTGFTGPRKGP